MKRRLCAAACLAALYAGPAPAQAPPHPARPNAAQPNAARPRVRPVCPGFGETGGARMTLAEMRAPVQAAVGALDDGRLEPPTPILATGKTSWLGISFPVPEDPRTLRVLGWFHVGAPADCDIPLIATHILSVLAEGEHPAEDRHRIYYRMPDIDAVAGQFRLYHKVSLRIALYGSDAAGALGTQYVGRRLDLVVSSRYGTVAAALAFAIAFYLLAAAAVVAAGRREPGLEKGWRAAWSRLLPWNILGDDGHTALAQLQMLLFTLIIATLLFYQWLRTGVLQELSTDLLYLLGISTAGAAGSQVTAGFKKGMERRAADYVDRLGWFTAPLRRPRRRVDPSGLLMTGGRFDANKFQMLVFTVVIAAYVIQTGASELDTLHISSTLLTLMGMSQGAYVGGHAMSDGLATLQHNLRGMQALHRRWETAGEPGTRDELARRFAAAAARAAVLFGALYGREVPADMLSMPPDGAGAADEAGGESVAGSPA